MRTPPSADTLRHNLEEALDLLKDYAPEPLPQARLVEPLPSLLEQCETLCAALPETEPLRSVHHMACTGGTLLSKCLAVMPNVTLLSEIDPLSTFILPKRHEARRFAPSDVIYGARTALRPIDDATAEAVFAASIEALHGALCAQGQRLVLRDHAHSQFCTDTDFAQRPTLREMLARRQPVLSVVTVRHPLDSFLSLHANGWRNFAPFTIEEYARRYAAFLARHDRIRVWRYEDFLDDPDGVLEQICAALDLPFVAGAEDLLSLVSLSGDSGRSANRIGRRKRREVPEEIRREAAQSAAYAELCDTLGYAPETG
ncbi:sulfotransferase [Actibacterium sp. MT2.3-13A]|uniref:sulfotransferase n=1 Tax=Actibacterium sp. MT2.3-13A TaxID=2828332 RepID=UPI001BAE26F2|nr:sulfotransferase [Actibacterium sp. MT2.3-13A]